MASNSGNFAITDNTLLSGTSGKDKIYVGDPDHRVQNVTVESGSGKDIIAVQNALNSYINTGADNDSVLNSDGAFATTISTGGGNDTITIFSTDTTTINLDGGSNLINVYADTDLVINGGANSEYKFSYANHASVGSATHRGTAAGATLRGTNGVDTFIPVAGNVIVGYGGEDNIQFSGSVATAAGSNDVTLNGSSGSVVVKNVAAHSVKLNGSAASNGAYSNTTPQNIIQQFMASLDQTTLSGTAALDAAILALNVSKFASMQDVIDSAVNDCKNVKNADVFLRDYCGIVLDNQDTGAITGFDASGSANKTAKSVVPESGSTFGSATAGASFNVDGLTIKLPDNLTPGVQTSVASGLQQWWAKGALDLIKQSYGDKYSFNSSSSATVKEMDLTFSSAIKGSTLARVDSTSTDGSTTSKLSLVINANAYNTITDENGATTVKGSTYLDRTLAHEFTHAVMSANITNFAALPAYIKEGMAELTHGIDDERATLISSLGGNSSKLKSALSNKTTAANESTYAGGYILLRYLAQQAANSPLANGMHINAKRTVVSLTAAESDPISTLNADDYDSTVVTIDAAVSEKALCINGNDKDNVLAAGKLGATLNGGKGNDKLYGNSGADTFIYNVGEGKDVIGNTGKNLTHTLYDKNDRIIIVGDADSLASAGFITFKDSKNAVQITFAGEKNSQLLINRPSTDVTVTIDLMTPSGTLVKTITHGNVPDGVSLDSKTTTATLTSEANNTTINAAEINSQIKIIDATDAAQVYVIGNNQATTVSLNGGTVTGGYDYVKGKGLDDKFYGTDGAKDVIVYSLGGGKDQAYNLNGADGDMIVLQGLPDTLTTLTSEGDINFKDSGKGFVITLNEGKTKGSLTINDSNNKISIYKDGALTTPLLTFGVDMPDYTSYGKNNASVVIANDSDSSTAAAAQTVTVDLARDGYSAGVKELDATNFDGKVSVVGNAVADVLKASKGGSTLDGGYDIIKEKATGDKLYGNSGADTFVYRLLPTIGGGTDVIGGDAKYSIGNYENQDRIIITSSTPLTAADITVTDAKNNATTLTFGKKDKLTVNKKDTDTTLKVYFAIEGSDLSTATLGLTHGEMPAGVKYGVDKKGNTDFTMLSVGGAAAGSTITSSNINSLIKNINLTNATNSVYAIGNAAANNISVGAAGGTIDGGLGNDKLFGDSSGTVGATFVHTFGEGTDEIANYVGKKDTIVIRGWNAPIDVADKNQFKDSGKDISINLSSGTTKSTLKLKSPNGKLTILGEDGSTLLSYGKDLPDPTNMTYNSARTVLTVGANAQLGDADTTIRMEDYSVILKEIVATDYSAKALNLVATNNKGSYVLKAGKGGSTLQGGAGTDKLYGDTLMSATDVFVYSVGGGTDQIYNYNGADDEIWLLGYDGASISTATKNNKEFKDSGKDVTLTLGTGKLSLKEPLGQIKVYGATVDNAGKLTKGAQLLSYDSNLPSGIEYNSGKTQLTVTQNYSASAVTVDASVADAYSSKLKTISAIEYNGKALLKGNELANELYAGKGGSTLAGGAGNDKLFGKTDSADVFVFDLSAETISGAADTAYNYNAADGDVIKIDGVASEDEVQVTYNGKTLVLACSSTVGTKTMSGKLTVNGRATGSSLTKCANIDTNTTVSIQIGNGAVKSYTFLKKTKNKMTLSEMLGGDDPYARLSTGSGGSSTGGGSVAGGSSSITTRSQLASSVEEYWFTENVTCSTPDSTDELSGLLEIEPLAVASTNEFNALTEFVSEDDRELGSATLTRYARRKLK